jgi:hypothetical protein
VLIGIGLIVLGMFLSPFIIGIPIMIAGFLIGDFGILLGIVRWIPGLEKKIKSLGVMVINSYRPYFRKEAKKK